MVVWHAELTPGAADAAPSAVYQLLTRFTRPSEDTFKAQLDYLNGYAELRVDRASEILAQLAEPTAFLSSLTFLRPDRTRWTLELLGAALRLAKHVEMRLKHALACRRPIEFSPQVQPMILTPSHGSLPSGHCTEAFTTAVVLWSLLRDAQAQPYADSVWGEQFMHLAARIAINRTVAGMHFPVDSVAGAILGLTLGHYLVARCSGASAYPAAGFDGEAYPDTEDFFWGDLYQVTGGAPGMKYDEPYVVNLKQSTIAPLGENRSALAWLWGKAKSEWT